MTILLELGAKPLIYQPTRTRLAEFDFPLHYAVSCGCRETVSILLQNDSPILGLSIDKWDPDEYIREIIHQDFEMENLLIEALVDRRRRLQDLAILSLSPAVLHELALDSNRLVDQKASLVQKVLFENHVWLSPSLTVSTLPQTIYHHQRMTTELAERLYNLGFQDVNGRDFNNQTPLATVSFLAWSTLRGPGLTRGWQAGLTYAAWLVSKEPEAPRSISGTATLSVGATAAHHILYRVGWISGYWYPDLGYKIFQTLLSEFDRTSMSFDMLRTLLAADSTDDCACACSVRGCLPYVFMLKGFELRERSSFRKEQSSSSYLEWHLSVITWLDSCQDSGFSVPVSVWADLIRLETFNALGLTHVCCHGSTGEDGHPCCKVEIDESEAKEIRQEEADMIHQLEALMSEFEDELQEHQSIVPFFEGYWKRRMSEVLLERDPLQPDEYVKLREIGVVLSSDPETCSPAMQVLGLEEDSGSRTVTDVCTAIDGGPNLGTDCDPEVSSDLDEFFEVDGDSDS